MAFERGQPSSRDLICQQLFLEVRSHKLGFAIVNGTELVDWGVRFFPPGAAGTEMALKILAFLVKIYAPSIVVARRTRRVKHASSEKASYVFRKIQRELKRRSIRFTTIPRRDVRRFFVRQGCFTKPEIEAFVAQNFGELKFKLPGRRRLWDKEPYVVPAFDALATALVFKRSVETGESGRYRPAPPADV